MTTYLITSQSDDWRKITAKSQPGPERKPLIYRCEEHTELEEPLSYRCGHTELEGEGPISSS